MTDGGGEGRGREREGETRQRDRQTVGVIFSDRPDGIASRPQVERFTSERRGDTHSSVSEEREACCRSRCRKVCKFGGGKGREFPSVGFYFTNEACGSASSRAGMESREEEGGRHSPRVRAKQAERRRGQDCEAVWMAPLQSEAGNLKLSPPMRCEHSPATPSALGTAQSRWMQLGTGSL